MPQTVDSAILGFGVSLGIEWIVNNDGKSKQDFEYNAALRLFEKLKTLYPRLRIWLLLYAKIPIMKKIKENNWEFINVWKDKTMYARHDDVELHRANGKLNVKQEKVIHNQYSSTTSTYEYCTEELNHDGTLIYYLKQLKSFTHLKDQEKDTYKPFVFMSSIACDVENFKDYIRAGRIRWKIENEGFNAQKKATI